MMQVFPRGWCTVLVLLLFVANTINHRRRPRRHGRGRAAADRRRAHAHLYTVVFALVSLLAVVFVPYHRYVGFLKWLTFSLFAYVGVVFTVQDRLARGGAGRAGAEVRAERRDSLTLIVAIFGTTISPYLFFWQSSQEVEDEEADPDGRAADQTRPSRRAANSTASAGTPGSAWRSPTWSPSSSS